MVADHANCQLIVLILTVWQWGVVKGAAAEGEGGVAQSVIRQPDRIR